ncbi:MAG: TrmJ/YjtD family RNA methyltransferase [Deltaproteobacteria bacterium]|nr:TrmJ/YjtD family RNA methyltransferase [Deltaproteobacteria bacterium]
MLENIRIILVRPRGSGNIGSVARAMKNVGLKDLVVVGKGRTQTFGARAMAVHAKDLLKEIRKFESLREAVADCGLVIGTTCRGGLYRSHSRTLREAAPDMVAAAKRGLSPVALVFGPEDHGLNNRDLMHCQGLITIPTHQDYPSLNVAQAVMVCLYELYLSSFDSTNQLALNRAQAENIERLFDRMRSSLLKIGFLDSHNPDHILLALRRILGRAGLEEKDVRILMALFRQIEWYATGGWRVAQDKERRGVKIR